MQMSLILNPDKSRWLSKIFLLSFLLMIIALSASGCAQLKIQDNRFTSYYPRLNIDIGKEFKYWGSDEYGSVGFSHEHPTVLSMGQKNNQFYFFAPDKIDKQIIRKGVIVTIITLEKDWFFIGPTIDAKRRNVFNYEIKSFNGTDYECGTMYSTRYSRPLTSWLEKKGYALTGCNLIRLHAKLVNNAIASIEYFEDASMSGFTCEQWDRKSKWSDEQKEYLKHFVERASKAVEIL